MLIKRDPDILKSYLEDSSNMKGGHADGIAVPSDIGELSAFLKDCNSKGLPVTISGGGTGTTGSRIPLGGMVLSLERFNKIKDISPSGMTATVETGVLVEDLKKACDAKGLFYTSHPTEGSATVGGTVATNASGARSFKYGPTRRYVRRLRMVLADGRILDLRRGEAMLKRGNPVIDLPDGQSIKIPMPTYVMPDVKSSSGYYVEDDMDLIDLFIGQEGTLSVITDIEIELVRKPEKIFSAFAFFRTEEDTSAFAASARELSKKRSGEGGGAIDALSIEYFDSNALDLLRKKSPNVPQGAAGAIFFEQECLKGREAELAQSWLDLIGSHNGLPDDTWVAMNEKEAAQLGAFRYSIPESVNDIVRKNGFQKLSTDIAVPEAAFPEMLRFYRESLRSSGISHVVFGHIGECHLHANVLPRSEEESRRGREMVLQYVRKAVSLGGTVSAEHGIGKIKRAYLEELYGKGGIVEMARLKKALDPKCILGLDNLFPKELLKSI